MDIYLENTEIGLKPLYDSDNEQKRQLKLGKVYKATIKLERNYEFHKKFFAMIKVGHNNTKLDMPFDAYRAYILMKAGYVKFYATPKGVMPLPESIAFDKMSEEDFRECYKRCLDKVAEDIEADQYLIEKELAGFL